MAGTAQLALQLDFGGEPPQGAAPVVDLYRERCKRDRAVYLAMHPNARASDYYSRIAYGKVEKSNNASGIATPPYEEWRASASPNVLVAKGKAIQVPKGLAPEFVEDVIDWIDFIWSFDYISDKSIASNFVSSLKAIFASAEAAGCLRFADIDERVVRDAVHGNRWPNILGKISLFNAEHCDQSGGFDIDIWRVSRLVTDESRLNPSTPVRTLTFGDIELEANKVLAKRYVKYLCEQTDDAVTYIKDQLAAIKILMRLLGETHADAMSREDAISVRERLREENDNTAVFNLLLRHITAFTDWLYAEGHAECSHFYREDKVLGEGYRFKESSVDEYVVDQIFQALPELDEKPRLFFLAIYCTGMRESEAVELKKDCLFEADEGFFIDFTSEKMHDKKCSNPIPEPLYRMIADFRDSVRDTPKGWLFPNTSGSECVNSLWLTMKVQTLCDEHSVVTSEGERYIFKPHDFRHTLAVDALDAGVPFHMVQEALHHKSRKMTTAYSEMLSKRARRIALKVVDIHGEEMELAYTVSTEGQGDSAEWLRSVLNPQILCNGICGKPVRLGKCDHAYDCLTCPEFRTSRDFLDVHRRQLESLECYMNLAKQEGLLQDYETAKAQAQTLQGIICSLEGDGDAR